MFKEGQEKGPETQFIFKDGESTNIRHSEIQNVQNDDLKKIRFGISAPLTITYSTGQKLYLGNYRTFISILPILEKITK